jgi:hypothetical protein
MPGVKNYFMKTLLAPVYFAVRLFHLYRTFPGVLCDPERVECLCSPGRYKPLTLPFTGKVKARLINNISFLEHYKIPVLF